MAAADLLRAAALTAEIDWKALYDEELPRVYNFFRYRVGDDPLAEDLTASTFERAWKSRHRYRRDRAAFSTWLFTIARRVAADHFRRRKPESRLDHLAEIPDVMTIEAVVQQQNDLARLSTLLSTLPPRERELISLKYGAGLQNREIAKLTGLTESNVGTILHRTVASLRAGWERSDE